MGPTVLLLHTEESGRSHFDWLMCPDSELHEADERVLIHFRVDARPDRAAVGELIEATRGEPHRWMYLEFEGEVSGRRGTVERIAAGRCDLDEQEGDRISILVNWGSGDSRWLGTLIEGDRWRLERHG